MVAQFPNLKVLRARQNQQLTGNIESLQVIGSTLEEICLAKSPKVEGSIKSLAKFPRLKKVILCRTKITGNIRDIGEDDFVALASVSFPAGVYGGEIIHRIEDAPDIMHLWHRLKRRNLGVLGHTRRTLASTSPQVYGFGGHASRHPPFHVEFVRAATRSGWRWTNRAPYGACEPNWLDPEPDPTDPQYEEYLNQVEGLAKDVSFYQGFHTPPTQMQHEELNDTIPPPQIPVGQADSETVWHFPLADLDDEEIWF
ncbi:MAG: hypothetical protein SGBAC_010023 [Bacillariaceae sp.]